MSKELSPLEALEKILNKFVEILLEVKCEKPTAINITYLTNSLRVAFHNELDIIETALKRAEELEIENSKQFEEKWVQDNLAMTFELNVAHRKLKALEILKEILDIKIHIDEEENVAILYVDIVKDFETKEFTHIILGYVHDKERYDLLKEVLE